MGQFEVSLNGWYKVFDSLYEGWANVRANDADEAQEKYIDMMEADCLPTGNITVRCDM